jgi:phospho-N-acetylmuramoyl-pentapeptide-transferase
MLIIIINFLTHVLGLKVPAVFGYVSTRMLLAFSTSLLITIIAGKSFIKKLYELKIGDRVREEDCPLLGQLHKNKKDTPTMGGMLILFSLFVSLALWMNWQSSTLLILLFTTLVAGGLGAYDDYLKLRYKNTKGLSAKKKLLILIGLSLAVGGFLLFSPGSSSKIFSFLSTPLAKDTQSSTWLTSKDYISRLYVPLMKHYVWQMPVIITLLFITFVIVGASNAVNLTDGLDGLAAGTVLFASAAFALIAFISNNIDLASYLNILYIEDSGEVAIYLAALSGACMGFLWYNSHPAQVFMGDTGSLPLGAILGVSAVLLKKELLLGIIGGVFVAEALSVILQVCSYRYRNKKRIFLCAPLHHHFEYKGWAETKVVARFWIIAILLAAIGIITLKFQ